MLTFNLSDAPGPAINAAKAAITRHWADGMTLEDAIHAAANRVTTTAQDRGCDTNSAERMAWFVIAVGDEMRAEITDMTDR